MRILECGGDWSLAKKSIEVSVVPKVTKLIGYNVHEFIALDLPPREYIIEDFMAKGDLHMIMEKQDMERVFLPITWLNAYQPE